MSDMALEPYDQLWADLVRELGSEEAAREEVERMARWIFDSYRQPVD